MIQCLSLIMIMILGLGCSSNTPVLLPTSASLSAEDYQAFSAILRQIGKANGCACVVSRSTVSISDPDLMKQANVKSAHREFLRVLSQSTTETTLTARFDADLKVKLASGAEIIPKGQEHSVGDFWDQFYKKFPNSRWVSLSIPVWNKEKTEVMIYAANRGGGLDGVGNLYFLTRDRFSRRWRIRQIYTLWIS